MTTPYTGSFSLTNSDQPGLGDGDENDFFVSAAGNLSFSIQISSSGNVTGNWNLASGSVSGSTNDDTDGDDDSFGGSGSGGSTVSGSVGSGISTGAVVLSDGGEVTYTGTFNSSQTAITGTVTISDPSLPGNLTIPNVTVSGGSPPPPPPASPPTFPTTPQPENIDNNSANVLYDKVLEEGATQLAQKAFQVALKNSKSLFTVLPNSAPAGLSTLVKNLGQEINGNALPWGNAGSAATAKAAGNLYTLVSTFFNAYDVGTQAYQNGVFSTPALQADVKLVGTFATAYVGQIIEAGVVAGYVEPLVAAAAVVVGAPAAPIVVTAGLLGLVGFAFYTVGTYVKGGSSGTFIDGADFCGPQAVQNQAQTYITAAPGSDLPAALASAGSPLAFANPVSSYGGAPPQAGWSYNADTGTFSWLASSSAPLTQALSQMGVTQFAAPLTLSGDSNGGELITGGPDGDHLSVGPGGNVEILGGSGSNLVTAGPGSNILDGGVGGTNTLDYSGAPAGVNVNLASGKVANGWGGTDTISDFQIINGSNFNDTFEAGPGTNTINGEGGANLLVFTGARINYSVHVLFNGPLQITDLRTNAPDGVSDVTNIQNFQFTDKTETLAQLTDTTAPLLIHDGMVTVGIGLSATIPSSQLQFTDNVSTDAQETYTVVTGPAHGTLFDNGVAATTFTQADVDNGLLKYTENGSIAASDSFTFKVTDFSGNSTTTQTFNFQLADQTPPALIHNVAITVALGSSAVISASQLQFIDNVSTDAQETYTIIASPADGKLLKNGSAVTTFSQADIDNSLISYQNTGVASSDGFTFKVTDAASNSTATQQFQFQLVDKTPPALTDDGSVTLGIAHTVTIPASQLQFTDNVSTDAQETYTVTTPPAHGTLLKSGAAVTTFTQADIDNGLISYQENGSVVPSDSFAFTVTDAAGNPTVKEQFAIQVLPPGEVMLRNMSTGGLQLYAIDNNQILGNYSIAQAGLQWSVAGFADFSGNAGETDMLLYNVNSGAFALYDIVNNQVAGTNLSFGQVGLNWMVEGFGDFSGNANETDMMMRSASGAFQIFDISNSHITKSVAAGQVGLEWSVAGFGDFSGNANETDMLMRRTDGTLEVFDISNNAITKAVAAGQVGPEWSIVGFGDFSGNANETDMMMRRTDGTLEVFDIGNNGITKAVAVGQVGPEWLIAGFGDYSGNVNETDMLMRNSSSGAFELYDISNNKITNAFALAPAGQPWTIGGVAVDPPAGATASWLAPSLINDGSITLVSGTSAVIAASQLDFTDNFSADAQETYKVTTAPAHGTLMRNGAAVSSFTQGDIDNGLVSYQATGSIAASDSFAFTVTDASGNSTATQQFAIQILPPAEMFMRNGAGALSLYDISNNQYLGIYSIGQVGPEWSVTGLADFSGNANETDMLMRRTDGAFLILDVSNNSITKATIIGQVGPEWSVTGFGSFSGNAGEPDILMRSGSGAFLILDIANNSITKVITTVGQVGPEWSVTGLADFSGNANETDILMRRTDGTLLILDVANNSITKVITVGQVGPEWSVVGLADFSGNAGETDILMRSGSGAFLILDVANNSITKVITTVGQVGPEWSVVGLANFSGNANETDMLMRNSSSGAFELYDISNNQITGAYALGQIGPDWSVAGFGDFSGKPNESDMLMRSSSGAFELYDISNNKITGAYSLGQVGPSWSVSAINPTTPTTPASASTVLATQLAQAIATFTPNSSLSQTGTTPTVDPQTGQLSQILMTPPV